MLRVPNHGDHGFLIISVWLYYLRQLGIFIFYFARELLYYHAVAVANERFYKFRRKFAAESVLVPVPFVPVPGRFYFGVAVTQFYGVVGVAFQHEIVGAVKRYAGDRKSVV